MNFQIILFLLFLGSFSAASGQIGNVIDTRSVVVTSVSEEHSISKDLAALAQNITKRDASDKEKVTSIFNWITSRISYDTQLHHSRSLQQRIYTSEENVIKHVLERKKALCGGYAFLFERLCLEVGVEAQVIHGFTKTAGVPFRRKKSPTHTWNAVWLEGKWQLLDLTWAVSHGSTNKPSRFWLLTPKVDFDRSHVAM